ncbi:MAG: hypothetical protein FRX49_13725 [Trebouxia sp. A1-2]|nr:MAG: hypothetical protein FRX49_13725 [Trebouxia sp. A1-2]
MTGGLPEGIAGVEHLLVDCVDLQRRELWQYVAAWGAATHLLDPFTQRLHPKNQVFFRPSAAATQAHSQVAAHTHPLDTDQLLTLAAKYPANPQQSSTPSVPRPDATPCPPDPASLILAGFSRPSPRLAHPSEQPFQANQEVVRQNDSWPGPADGGVEGAHAIEDSVTGLQVSQQGRVGVREDLMVPLPALMPQVEDALNGRLQL